MRVCKIVTASRMEIVVKDCFFIMLSSVDY